MNGDKDISVTVSDSLRRTTITAGLSAAALVLIALSLAYTPLLSMLSARFGSVYTSLFILCCYAAGVGSAVCGYFLRRNARSIEKVENNFKQREAELLQSGSDAVERYKLLTENLAAAVIVRDRNGKILYCSPYTEILTGYAVTAIYGATGDFFEQIVHEDDRPKYLRSLQVTAQGEPFQFRCRFRHKTGLLMWAESRTVPILDDDGMVISSLSITLDVTGAVRYQQQVEEKNHELQDFTYMVSHDLKAPIFTMKGMLAIVGEELGPKTPEGLAEPLDHMQRAAHRLEQLVTSVLEYSRATSFEPKEEHVDLTALIDEVTADFKSQLSACGGSVSIEGKIPPIIGDQLKLIQVFSNILSNAIKYRSARRPLQVVVSSRSTAKIRTVVIAIADNGSGIPPDKLGLIFRPFQRLHGKEIEGSGIGLACVKKLIERLGGEITVESDGVSGSAFVLALPADEV